MKRGHLLGLSISGGLAAASLKAKPTPKASGGSSPVELGSDSQLFADDFLIERCEGLMRTLHHPSKLRENPVIQPDRPWEGFLALQPGTVIYDEEEKRFKMWYNALPNNRRSQVEQYICYATSEDGIRWEKPSLGLFEFQGSKANNILLRWCYWTLSVVKDPSDRDPNRRYKLAYGRTHGEKECGVWVAFSPDGIRWKEHPNNPLVPCTASGDTFSVMQEPRSKQFFLYHKTVMRPIRKVSLLGL